MNKILIVGHPLSGYQEVESLLTACGMSTALPSRREGFMPAQISATLCKAHRASPNLLLGSGDAIHQIDAGPVWHGMALDLMLGNLDQEIWGWADPQSVFLLDYWKNLDPNITFILVYDKPHSVLTQAGLNEASTLSAETLSQRSRNWYAYNAALLHFFHRNPARCLLVSSQQVHQSASSYLQKVRARIDAPWSENMERLSAPESVLIDSENENSEGNVICSDMLDTPLTRTCETHVTDENAVMFYLAEALIQQHPASLQLYDELQSVANLPLTDGETADYAPMDAWQSMAGQQQRLSQAEALNHQKQQLLERLSLAQADAEQLAQQRRQQIEQLREQLTAQTQLATETGTQYSAAKAQAEKRLAELGKQAEQLKTEVQAAKTKAAATPLPTANPALEQENELLLTQLHQVQEELERYYLENQVLKAPAQPKALVPVPARKLYGAADRVKSELPYRLGATMIKQPRTLMGWLGMPAAVARTKRQFNSEKALGENLNLPPLSQYSDAHKAEKARQHLSYRLGTAFIACSRSPVGWIKLPWTLSREVKSFKIANAACPPNGPARLPEPPQ